MKDREPRMEWVAPSKKRGCFCLLTFTRGWWEHRLYCCQPATILYWHHCPASTTSQCGLKTSSSPGIPGLQCQTGTTKVSRLHTELLQGSQPLPHVDRHCWTTQPTSCEAIWWIPFVIYIYFIISVPLENPDTHGVWAHLDLGMGAFL